jgi:hypothetical protein
VGILPAQAQARFGHGGEYVVNTISMSSNCMDNAGKDRDWAVAGSERKSQNLREIDERKARARTPHGPRHPRKTTDQLDQIQN